MIDGKGLGDKRINRVNVSLSNQYKNKLNRLATACNMRPTELAGYLIQQCLDNLKFVDQLQQERCIHPAYRVTVVRDVHNGRVIYVTKGEYQ
jgi:hypothetical protein